MIDPLSQLEFMVEMAHVTAGGIGPYADALIKIRVQADRVRTQALAQHVYEGKELPEPWESRGCTRPWMDKFIDDLDQEAKYSRDACVTWVMMDLMNSVSYQREFYKSQPDPKPEFLPIVLADAEWRILDAFGIGVDEN